MSFFRKICLIVLIPAIFLKAASGVAAVRSQQHKEQAQYDLDGLSKESELVFSGEVINVEYKKSLPTDSSGGIPHTFVTYRVDNILKGSTAENTVTLRFVGGPSDETKFLMLPHLPLFDKGESDLLFVAGNTEYGCPLAGCSTGRLRLVDGLTYNERGQMLMQTEDGIIEAGKGYNLEEVMSHEMSGTIKFRRTESEYAHEDAVSEDVLNPVDGIPLDSVTLVMEVQDSITRAHTEEELAAVKPFVNANIADDILFDLGQPAKAPVDAASMDSQLQDELDEQAEAKAQMKRNQSATPRAAVNTAHAQTEGAINFSAQVSSSGEAKERMNAWAMLGLALVLAIIALLVYGVFYRKR